ncbi:MAG: hypothetical protein IJT65_03040 [Eubacterium sp.]|nr:hypothetical protein [Eubacterium sp.]
MKKKKTKKKLGESRSNPTTYPDGKTETGSPIPNAQNVEYSKEWGEEHEV